MKGTQRLLAATILLMSSNAAFADFDPFLEFIVMGGISSVDAGNIDLVVSLSETDTLVQTNENDWDAWTGQLGFGYVMPLLSDLETGKVQWFPMITPQINFYVLGNANINGDVWRFQDPDYNQGTYGIDFDSTCAMFDLAVTIAAIDKFSIYAIGGLGASWNDTSFNATSNPGLDCPIEDVNLANETSTSFAYELGGGLTYAAADRVAISLEYLFTGFNDVALGGDSTARYPVAREIPWLV